MTDAPSIELVSFRPGPPRIYRVAGSRLVTDFIMPGLRTYVTPGKATWSAEWDMPLPDGGERVYGGQGLIADGMRLVTCHVSATGCRLTVEGIGTYWISPDGRRIAEVEINDNCETDTRAMAALGAPLILALAARGTFCLHASVVTYDGRLVAFIGESGAGKSTLARFLDTSAGPAWTRIIDDTLPLTIDGQGQAVALPHFPQLKLPDGSQPSRLVPEQMALSAVYRLVESKSIDIDPIAPGEGAVTLAGQTVASRLFGRALLVRHLDFCSKLALRFPIQQLAYPRDFESLLAVQKALAANLDELS